MAELGETIRLVELTCARLCHDLGGLIGTLGSALDMVAEDTGRDNEVLAFARSASRALTERLRLMRAAWGPETEAMTIPALRTLAAPNMAARRIALETGSLPPDSHFPPAVGRVVLNLILLAADCLPRGGVIALTGEPDDLFVRMNGPEAAWPDGFVSFLYDEAAAVAALKSVRSVQMSLTVLFALSGKLRLSPVLGHPAGLVALRLNRA